LRIPDSEFRERANRVKKAMANQSIDLLFIYSNLLDPANVRYLTDFSPLNESSALLVPSEGDPILCCGQACQKWAAYRSRIRDIRIVPEIGEVAGVEYEIGEQVNFTSILKEVGASQKVEKVGIVGSYILPYKIYNQIREVYRKAKLVDADNILIDMRMIKSENEIKMISKAADIMDRSFTEVIRILRAGMTELEIRGALEHAMLANGAEDHAVAWPPMIASGPEHTSLSMTWSSNRKVGEGEMLAIQAGCVYQGYNAALCCPHVFGSVPKKMQDAIYAANEALHAVLDKMEPGVTGEELNAVGRSILEKWGFSRYSPYGLVHSIGLLECEPPFLGPKSKIKLKPNMTLCIDVYLMGMDFGGFRFEDTVAVTKTGIERLTKYNEENFPL
jgi:Xaa-Pro aminopeptidase